MEKPGKIKILAIGDIHGDTGLVKKLAERAKKEEVELVILAGDITFAEQSTDYLIGPFIKAGKKVLLIPGNHESIATVDFLAEKYNAENIHGKGFKKDHLGIFGAGTALMGLYQIPESEIFELLKKGHLEIKDSKRKLMVTHIHPRGSKSEISGISGSEAVRKAIEKFNPDIAINSHIHEAGGTEEEIGKTKVVNVSRKEKVFEM